MKARGRDGWAARRGGGSRAWGMSDGVPGRSVTASQRCRPLSGRQDMCGGRPLPPPCPRIYGFVKARRGAEARPAVGGFDVSWPPRWVSALRNGGKAGPGPAGLLRLRVTHTGGSRPDLLPLLSGPRGLLGFQATPSVAHLQLMHVLASPGFWPLPTQVPLPGVREAVKVPPTFATLASAPPAVWGFLLRILPHP